MPLVAYDLALDLVSRLREPLATVLRHDADLARRAYRALANVLLYISQAVGHSGRKRVHRSRIALGGLRELGATLDVAAAFGWLPAAPCVNERDRLCGVLYGLQRSG